MELDEEILCIRYTRWLVSTTEYKQMQIQINIQISWIYMLYLILDQARLN